MISASTQAFHSQFADQGNEGYVQGMSDLCAPIYVVMGGDEELTFWCFVEVMDRMVSGRYSLLDCLDGAPFRNKTSCVIKVECEISY